MSKEPRNIAEEVKVLAETWGYVATHAADIAFAKRSLYQAYILEGFNPYEALELCKTI
jgi:hypothetical protein